MVRGPAGENWAVEVKTGAATEGELRGLRAFCGQYRQFEPCLVRLRESRLAAGGAGVIGGGGAVIASGVRGIAGGGAVLRLTCSCLEDDW